MNKESDIMITSNDSWIEELHTFINYCQKHPIDMRIINELDKSVMNSLRNNLSIKRGYNTNNIYMMLNIYQHIYIFQFKDTSLRKFILMDQNYNFDYDEGCITLNEHNLKYITFRDYVYKTNSIYTFDENTRCVIIKNEIKEMNNHIYLHNDI